VKGLLFAAGVLLFAQQLDAGTVVGSRHDLSTPYTPQVCEFCHTPQHANASLPLPFWNRADIAQTFTLYGSPTMNVTVAQPRVASRLCLSCHDGINATTVVHGNVVSNKHDLLRPPAGSMSDTRSWPNCERCHSALNGGRPRMGIGTDLSNDHPVSMPYPTTAQDTDFWSPPDALKGWGGLSQYDVKLYAGGVECGSCHNVHDPGIDGRFLRKPNARSQLCLTCHNK
jgi:predicted CXXCH cytochrome family protein